MDGDGRLFIGVMRVELQLTGVGSLKGKRAMLNRVRAQLVRQLDCSVAEVGHQDRWQRAVLGVTVAASTESGAQRALDRVVPLIERDPRLVVLRAASYIDSYDGD